MELLNFLARETNLPTEFLCKIIKKAPFLYFHKKIPKPDGKHRILSIPYKNLKIVQENILKRIFYKEIRLPDCAHGGITKKSIKTNAQPHTNQPCVVNLDIKNFFPSIRISMLEERLKKFNFENDSIKILIRLITNDFCLPQGAPTSPFISNLPLIQAEMDIKNLCRKNFLKYTRYFDDITISGKNANKFIDKIEKIINQSGFKMNPEKIKIQLKKKPQYVTGLLVNKKLLIPRESINEIENKLSNLEKFGLNVFVATEPIKELAVLNGKIAFLCQIQPNLGSKMKKRFQNIKKKLNL